MSATRTGSTAPAFHGFPHAPQGQRGIATILIMLLIGLSLTAATLGVMHYIRGSQSQLLSVHSQTQAQMRAWTGAEAVGQFLGKLSDAELVTLAGKVAGADATAVTISGVTGLSAKFVAVDNATKPTSFTAEITGVAVEGSQAESRSSLQVVYQVTSEKPVSRRVFKGPGQFNKGVSLGGGIKVEKNEDGSYDINVLGDFSAGSISLEGINRINSTGSVYLTNGSANVDEINANCDVRLEGSYAAKVINARRNVCLENIPGSDAVTANGSVYILNSGYKQIGKVSAIGNATGFSEGECQASGFAGDASKNLVKTCNAPKEGIVVDIAGAKSVLAKGNVFLSGDHIGDLQAEGDLTISNTWMWDALVDSGSIGGKVKGFAGNLATHIKIAENVTGLTVSIPMVSRVTLSTYVVDAYDYESIANYAFRVDADGYKKVTISNVNGIDGGEYYLVDHEFDGATYPDSLCEKLDSSASTPNTPKCLVTNTPLPTICKNTDCFGYDSSTATWTVSPGNNAEAIAPGIAWFDGNLVLSWSVKGYFNTFIATGDIATVASVQAYAPNFAGYTGSVGGMTYAPSGICENASFPGIYPKQFCDTKTKTYLQDADSGIGNYVLIAGSVKPGMSYSEENYVGGNIHVGASNDLRGSVLAGNEFQSSGDTTVHGYITALGAGIVTKNSLGAKTTIVLTGLPESFDPYGGSDDVEEGGSPPPGKWGIRWSRYL